MRSLRLSVTGTVTFALLGGLGLVAIAQSDVVPEGPTAEMLDDAAITIWNTDDIGLLTETYAPEAVHRVIYFDRTVAFEGRDRIAEAATGSVTLSRIAPILELDAPEGELRWVGFYDATAPGFAGQGTVCHFWARDGQVVRHDCLLPF